MKVNKKCTLRGVFLLTNVKYYAKMESVTTIILGDTIMKKFLILILALCMVLPLASCDGKETNGSLKGDKYSASHSHLYPYSEPLRFESEEYYTVIDGTKADI